LKNLTKKKAGAMTYYTIYSGMMNFFDCRLKMMQFADEDYILSLRDKHPSWRVNVKVSIVKMISLLKSIPTFYSLTMKEKIPIKIINPLISYSKKKNLI